MPTRATEKDLVSKTTLPRSPLATLFAPIGHLLPSGGDARLRIDPQTKLNGYGCRPFPRPEALTFASSTATSISERSYDRCERARAAMVEAALKETLDYAFEARAEGMRAELRALLGIGTNIEIVLSPSGTDSQLHAVGLARACANRRLVSIVVGADQTGSGTPLSAVGSHFADRTAQDIAVQKGAALLGLDDIDPPLSIALCDHLGRPHAPEEIDAATMQAVGSAVGAGRDVLLHVMDSSKFGWRSPSQHCIAQIQSRWPDAVQVVIDACQFRLGRRRIAAYLDRGYMILVTGSKFFTGAPFSGALLVPTSRYDQKIHGDHLPAGLSDYINRTDWPVAWQTAHAQRFAPRLNFGQWLRWESALEEMGAYFAVPALFRQAALEAFGRNLLEDLMRAPSLRPLPRQPDDVSDKIDDEEMGLRTIFPFLIRRNGTLLSPEDCKKLYQNLNTDVSRLLPPAARASEKRLAATLCHIGQPALLRDGEGGMTAALRISAGARIVSESWTTREAIAQANVLQEIEDAASILAKIELLLTSL